MEPDVNESCRWFDNCHWWPVFKPCQLLIYCMLTIWYCHWYGEELGFNLTLEETVASDISPGTEPRNTSGRTSASNLVGAEALGKASSEASGKISCSRWFTWHVQQTLTLSASENPNCIIHGTAKLARIFAMIVVFRGEDIALGTWECCACQCFRSTDQTPQNQSAVYH